VATFGNPCVKGTEKNRPPVVLGTQASRSPANAGTQAQAATLPNTGAGDLTGLLSLVGAGLVVAGLTTMGMRRRQAQG
jgi:LPXTG-motif cell wall-anchored protein